jgi:glycolate oxidase iron-sulfur subunit
VAAACWEALDPRRAEGEAGQVLTDCSGCVLQLAATAPATVRVGHWLDAVRLPAK